MEKQWSEEEKAKLVDFVIGNDGSKTLIPQVLGIHKRLLSAVDPNLGSLF